MIPWYTRSGNASPSEREDKISIEEALKMVQKLNLQIVEPALAIFTDLASVAPGDVWVQTGLLSLDPNP